MKATYLVTSALVGSLTLSAKADQPDPVEAVLAMIKSCQVRAVEEGKREGKSRPSDAVLDKCWPEVDQAERTILLREINACSEASYSLQGCMPLVDALCRFNADKTFGEKTGVHEGYKEFKRIRETFEGLPFTLNKDIAQQLSLVAEPKMTRSKTFCMNRVDSVVACTSEAAMTKHTIYFFSGQWTVRNDSDVPIKCGNRDGSSGEEVKEVKPHTLASFVQDKYWTSNYPYPDSLSCKAEVTHKPQAWEQLFADLFKAIDTYEHVYAVSKCRIMMGKLGLDCSVGLDGSSCILLESY